jgi:hypothetical protein
MVGTPLEEGERIVSQAACTQLGGGALSLDLSCPSAPFPLIPKSVDGIVSVDVPTVDNVLQSRTCSWRDIP